MFKILNLCWNFEYVWNEKLKDFGVTFWFVFLKNYFCGLAPWLIWRDDVIVEINVIKYLHKIEGKNHTSFNFDWSQVIWNNFCVISISSSCFWAFWFILMFRNPCSPDLNFDVQNFKTVRSRSVFISSLIHFCLVFWTYRTWFHFYRLCQLAVRQNMSYFTRKWLRKTYNYYTAWICGWRSKLWIVMSNDIQLNWSWLLWRAEFFRNDGILNFSK